jgi:hypothetical protein
MFVVILVLSAYLGYRLCILNQHQTEVPRVVLNQVRARIRAITAPSSCGRRGVGRTAILMRPTRPLVSREP